MTDEFDAEETLAEGNQDPEVKEWVEAILGESLPSEDLYAAFKDGVYLCKLLVTLQPSKYGDLKYFPNPKNSTEVAKNVTYFIEACEALNVPAFELEELVDCTNLYAVISAVCTYGQAAQELDDELGDLENLDIDGEPEDDSAADVASKDSHSEADSGLRDKDSSSSYSHKKSKSTSSASSVSSSSSSSTKSSRDKEKDKKKSDDKKKPSSSSKSSRSTSSISSSSSSSKEKKEKKSIPSRDSRDKPKKESESSRSKSSSSSSSSLSGSKKQLIPQVSKTILDDIQKNLGREKYLEAIRMRKDWESAERINQAYADFIKQKKPDWEAFAVDVFN